MERILKTLPALSATLTVLTLALLIAAGSSSCGAAWLASQLGQIEGQLGNSIDDDGTPDQGTGDFGQASRNDDRGGERNKDDDNSGRG